MIFAGLLASAEAVAANHNFTLGDADNRTLRLNVPDSVPVVRGILIWSNGANSDLRGMAPDAEIVAPAGAGPVRIVRSCAMSA